MTRTEWVPTKLVLLLALGIGQRPVFADDDPGDLDAEYLYDGGAIPLLYAPIAASFAIRLIETPETPRLFSAAEGGKPPVDRELPKWVIDAGAVSMLASIPLYGDESRWFHVKGMAQTLVCTSAVTALTKRVFGRHRPDAVPFGPNSASQRRSFFSGHASTTFAATTYYGLFLRQRGLERFRDGDEWPWWELVVYTGLTGVSAAAASERVIRNRHHVSDAVTGAAVGAGIAILLFRYQDSRSESARTSSMRLPPHRITVPLLSYGASF